MAQCNEPYVEFRTDMFEFLPGLTNKERGNLLLMLYRYLMDGIEPAFVGDEGKYWEQCLEQGYARRVNP